MGDRTFSAEDVIRIYEDFLTADEQRTVDEFFAEEPEAPIRDNFFVDLESLESLVSLARGPLPSLANRLFSLVPFLASIVDSVQFFLMQADILIRRLLAQEEVDA